MTKIAVLVNINDYFDKFEEIKQQIDFSAEILI